MEYKKITQKAEILTDNEVRLMKKEEVGVWIKTFCLLVIRHIPKQLVFLFHKR